MGTPVYVVWFGLRMQAARDALPCTTSTPLAGNTAGEATPQKETKIKTTLACLLEPHALLPVHVVERSLLDLQRPTPKTTTIL